MMIIYTSVKLTGQRENLEQVYGSFIYKQLFIKNNSQLREEKCDRGQLLDTRENLQKRIHKSDENWSVLCIFT